MDAKSCSREWSVTDSLRAGLSTGSALSHSGREFTNLFETALALLHLSSDFVVGVQNGGVVAATEAASDLGEREIGELPAEVHGHLTSVDEGAGAVGRADFIGGDVEVLGRHCDHEVGGDASLSRVGQERLQDALGDFESHLGARQRCVGSDSDEGALKLTNVGLYSACDEVHDLRGNRQAVGLGLHLKDGDAGLEVGGLDVGYEAPFEARTETLLESRDLLGGPVRCDDDLAVWMKRVEGVKELLLGPLLAFEELNVVHHEEVHCAVAPVELGDRAALEGENELVHELLGRDVAGAQSWVTLAYVASDGVQEVGLAQAGPSVDEQGVVGLGRSLCHRERGRMSEAV